MAIIATDWHIEPLPESAPANTLSGVLRYGPLHNRMAPYVLVLVDGDDGKGWANIDIDGRVLRVIRRTSKTTGRDRRGDGVGLTQDTTLTDASGAVVVRLKVTMKHFYEQYDSDWEEGTLTVTYRGVTQTLAVGGGFAN